MKKFTAVLLGIILALTLAGCGKDDPGETTEAPTKIEISEAALNRIIDYLRSYGSMPAFEEAGEINNPWLISTFFYSDPFYDGALAERFGYENFTYMENIEETARRFINPQINLSRDSEELKYYDTQAARNSDLTWNPEEKLFMWNASGGSTVFHDYIVTGAVLKSGVYTITCAELRIEWDDEYFWNEGIVYSRKNKIGTAVCHNDETAGTIKIEYNYSVDFNTLPKTVFVLREKSNNEYSRPLFIIESKTIK